MYNVLEILKYTIPSLILFLTIFFLLRFYIKNEDRNRRTRMAIKNYRYTVPIRLQAYERVVLLLERISPESLLLRVNRQGMTSRQLQSELISNIRAEFEHNLSQQIYMSNEAWELVKSARSNLIKMINTVADNIEPDSPSIHLSRAILETVMTMDKKPGAQAIEFIKKEIDSLM